MGWRLYIVMPIAEISKLVNESVPARVTFHRVKEIWHDKDGFVFPVKVARSELAYQPTPAWDADMFGEEAGEQGGDLPPEEQED